MPPKIPIKDFREQLRLRAVDVGSLNEMKTGEEQIPAQMAEMKREIAEKKLLEYQVKVKKGDVNQFLASKYGEGSFNEAVLNGYDNSKARRDHGITYDYHVYFDPITKGDKSDKYANARPAAQYLITKPVHSPNGDRYSYHLPVHYADSAKTEVVTDLDSERVDSYGRSVSKSGLVHALEVYQDNLATGRNSFDANTLSILRRHGFIVDGKFRGDIRDKNVEKYLLRISEKNRHNALQYLNEEFKADAEDTESVEVETTEPAVERETAEPLAAESTEPVEGETTEPAAGEAPITTPPKEKAVAPPSQAPKLSTFRNKREFDAALSAITSPWLSKLDSMKTIGNQNFPYQKVITNAFLSELAAYRAKATTYINQIEADYFDVEEIEDFLFDMVEEAIAKRNAMIAKSDEIYASFKEAENELKEGVSLSEEDPVDDIINNIPKFKMWYEAFPQRIRTVINNTRNAFKDGDDYRANLEEAIEKLVESDNEYITRFSAAWKYLQGWTALRDGFKELNDSDPKATVKTALTESTVGVSLMQSVLKDLDLDGFDKLLKSVKYGSDRYQASLKSLAEKKEASEKRRKDAEAKAAREAEAAAAVEAARIKAENDAAVRAAKELISKDNAERITRSKKK